MARYYFYDIENGQLTAGVTVVTIQDHTADIANDDTEAMLLAEKNGGVVEPGRPKAANSVHKSKSEAK